MSDFDSNDFLPTHFAKYARWMGHGACGMIAQKCNRRSFDCVPAGRDFAQEDTFLVSDILGKMPANAGQCIQGDVRISRE